MYFQQNTKHFKLSRCFYLQLKIYYQNCTCAATVSAPVDEMKMILHSSLTHLSYTDFFISVHVLKSVMVSE